MKKYYTLGMAGHIDHGKTTLTKALTNIDTDRLQEEKLRAISIEPGYAPLVLTNDLEVSVVDVPGHEKFIRQMIAGVAGIDAVILVIAGDEGFMPQTKEHLHILHLLGIERGLIAVTKSEGLEEEMKEFIQEDILENTADTFLENCGVFFVDSISGLGLAELNNGISTLLQETKEREAGSGFRMPIDQSFSVKGHGTVVRGTIFNGTIEQGETVTLLPHNQQVRIKQLQVHHETRERSRAGQRAAMNLTGISYEKIRRGDVLVKGSYPKTNVIDISLTTVPLFTHPVKQRTPVKIHIGTSEVYGKIVFFDRNEISADNEKEILCQIRLDEEIIADRNDRFILRRPSPAETIGGGTVIDPYGEKYRYGSETVKLLRQKKIGTPEERIQSLLQKEVTLTSAQIQENLSLSDKEFAQINREEKFLRMGDWWLLRSEYTALADRITAMLSSFHEEHTLREGKDIADLHHELNIPSSAATHLINSLEEEGKLVKKQMLIHLPEFTPHFPKSWAARMNRAELQLQEEGLQVSPFTTVMEKHEIPSEYHLELKKFLEKTSMQQLDEKHLIAQKSVDAAVTQLRYSTDQSFTLQEAKQVLDISRKYLVPLLEMFDREKITKRGDNKRSWV